jgi:AcrR family transcriptional regulator
VTRATYHHGNLRRALLDAALGLLVEGGPETFTLREAARRVGVDHRAAYRHFADREALLAAVAVEGYRELVASVRRALSQVPPSEQTGVQRLQTFLRACVLFAAERPAYYRVMTGPRLNETGRFPEIETVLHEAFELLSSELIEGARRGDLTPLDPPAVTDTTVALWAATNGIASLILTRRVRVKPERLGEYVDRLLDRLLFGIAKRPEKPPPRKGPVARKGRKPG